MIRQPVVGNKHTKQLRKGQLAITQSKRSINPSQLRLNKGKISSTRSTIDIDTLKPKPQILLTQSSMNMEIMDPNLAPKARPNPLTRKRSHNSYQNTAYDSVLTFSSLSQEEFDTFDVNPVGAGSKKLGPSPSMKSFDGKVYTVKILSNWGGASKINISSMVLLDQKRIPIKVSRIKSIPAIENNKALESLVNENLVKADSNDIFSVPFPPEDFDIFSIVLMVDHQFEPKYLRVWNSRFETDACIRHIIVMDGTRECFSGEVPQAFGFDAQLSEENKSFIPTSHSSAILAELFPQLAPEKPIIDNYGYYPVIRATKLSIEILSTYSKEQYIGLNGIDIIDYDWKVIKWDDISDVIIKNCSSFTDPTKLFRENKESNESSDMFLCETKWREIPIIEIHFKKPIKISRMRIWNYNSSAKKVEYGIKQMKIRAGRKSIWVGKCLIGTGWTKGIGYNTTDIWFTDHQSIRKRENINHEAPEEK